MVGWPLIALYGLGVVLTGLVGCRHAMARDARIHKERYLGRAIALAVLIGQVNILVAALGLGLGWLVSPDMATLLACTRRASRRCRSMAGTRRSWG